MYNFLKQYKKGTTVVVFIHLTTMSTTVNMTIMLKLSTNIDLRELETRSDDIVYCPEVFSGAKFRCLSPSYSALIFRTGAVTLTGIKSMEAGQKAAEHLIAKLAGLGLTLDIVSLNVKNHVLSFNAGIPIHLPSFYEKHSSESSYETELFPGLIYKPKAMKVTILIFSSGKMIATGIRDNDQIINVQALLNELTLSL